MTRSEKDIQALLKAYDNDVDSLKGAIDEVADKSHTQSKVQREYGDMVVSLTDIEKTYKQNKNTVQAVRSAHLEIRQGEFVSLVGPSGSGKSTLLNMIAGLDKPTSGAVMVGGQDLGSLSDSSLAKYRMETLGFVFQFFYLQPFLTLQENIEVPLMFAGVKRAEKRNRSNEVLEAVGLADRVDFLPRQLSGGQMQRAAIARALINNPKIILADEPTGNLDSDNGSNIMSLFEEVRERFNTSLLVVTHDQAIAKRADRIVKMDDGVLK